MKIRCTQKYGFYNSVYRRNLDTPELSTELAVDLQCNLLRDCTQFLLITDCPCHHDLRRNWIFHTAQLLDCIVAVIP